MFSAGRYTTWLFAVISFVLIITAQPSTAQVAQGVQQSAAHTANINGTVTQSDGTPVAGAGVKLSGPAILTTTSDGHGVFQFVGIPWGTYQIVISSSLGVASRGNVVVNGDVTVVIQYLAGSHLKVIAQTSAHINITPANITSISPSDYAFQGNASWRELLAAIPGVSVGGGLNGGGNDIAAVPGSPYIPIIISINGALPYETSTLLDGMPLQDTSFYNQIDNVGNGVDLSTVPLNGFSAADVVRGPGADAPSIVNSIGGSFVLHAPGQVDHSEVDFSTSNDMYGGIISNIRGAFRLGRLSATIIYGINDSPGPYGIKPVIPAYSTAPATVNGQTFQSCTPVPYAEFGTTTSCMGFPANVNAVYQNCYCIAQNPILFCCTMLDTQWTQHNGSAALSYNIGDSITAQVFYAGTSSAMPEPLAIWPVIFSPGAGYSGSVAPGMHSYFAGGSTQPSVTASSLIEEKVTAYLGRGVLRVAALQFNSFENESSAYGCFPNGTYQVWGTGYVGATSPGTYTVFNGQSENLTFPPETFLLHSWVNNRDLQFSYATQLGQTSTVGASYTTSYYNNPYYYVLSEEGLTCAVIPFFCASRPSAVSSTTGEVRLHADTQLSDQVSLGVSWYFAGADYHFPYATSPNTWTDKIFKYNAPRFGATWHVNHDVALRLGVGGGYALPPLYAYYSAAGAGPPIFLGTEYEQTIANPNVQPEQSFGIDLGTDMRLKNDTVLSFDAYLTNLYGQLMTSGYVTTFNGLPNYVTEYGNLGRSRFEGINADIRHEPLRGIYWSLAFGLTRGYLVSAPAGFYNATGETCNFSTGAGCANTYLPTNINFTGYFDSNVPYMNGTAQLGYRWNPGRYVDITPTYYGNNNGYYWPAFLEFDAHAGYAVTKNLSVLATFRNITNIHGESYQEYGPSMGSPSVAGAPFWLNGLPYGPRAFIFTVNLKT